MPRDWNHGVTQSSLGRHLPRSLVQLYVGPVERFAEPEALVCCRTIVWFPLSDGPRKPGPRQYCDLRLNDAFRGENDIQEGLVSPRHVFALPTKAVAVPVLAFGESSRQRTSLFYVCLSGSFSLWPHSRHRPLDGSTTAAVSQCYRRIAGIPP